MALHIATMLLLGTGMLSYCYYKLAWTVCFWVQNICICLLYLLFIPVSSLQQYLYPNEVLAMREMSFVLCNRSCSLDPLQSAAFSIKIFWHNSNNSVQHPKTAAATFKTWIRTILLLLLNAMAETRCQRDGCKGLHNLPRAAETARLAVQHSEQLAQLLVFDWLGRHHHSVVESAVRCSLCGAHEMPSRRHRKVGAWEACLSKEETNMKCVRVCCNNALFLLVIIIMCACH